MKKVTKKLAKEIATKFFGNLIPTLQKIMNVFRRQFSKL